MDADAIAATVAVLASLLGAIVAIRQVTHSARLRRNLDFAQKAKESETGAVRLEALNHLERWTTAQLVGRGLVSGRLYIYAVLAPLMSVFSIVVQTDVYLLWASLVLNVPSCWLGLRYGMHVYTKRMEVARYYYLGIKLPSLNVPIFGWDGRVLWGSAAVLTGVVMVAAIRIRYIVGGSEFLSLDIAVLLAGVLIGFVALAFKEDAASRSVRELAT